MSEGARTGSAGWGGLVSDLSSPPAGPRIRLVAEVVLPLVFAILLTGWVRLTGFDLAAQEWIHRLGGNDWNLGEHPFWKWLYRLGPVPAALTVFAAMGAFALSWSKAGLRAWRRVFLFIILSGVIGPGVITNGIVKEYWGRPRPRELVNFGGRSEFEPVLTYDGSSEGLSFPCGHATMAFFFLAGYFLLRRHRPGWAVAVVFGSLSLGMLMGIARMTQGAHFFSDVLWAALVCWFTPMGLYYALRLDRSLVTVVAGAGKPMPLALKAGLSVLGLAMLAGVLLATPHGEKREYALLNAYAMEGPLTVRLSLARGRVEIVPGAQFRIVAEANGHGMPTSKIGRNYLETGLEEGASVDYTERVSGWFHEINANLRVEVPWSRLRRLKLDTGEAEVNIKLAEGSGRPIVEVVGGNGVITVDPGGQGLRLPATGDTRVKVAKEEPSLVPESSLYRLEIGKDFEGEVRIEGKKRP